jgi:hypothetical protein
MKLLFLLYLLYTTSNVHSQNAEVKDTAVYFIKARLIEKTSLPPGCGVFAWAIAQKFEIIESAIPEIKSGNVIIVQPCPEFLGKGFFKRRKTYTILVGRNNDAPFSFGIANKYDKEKIPVFWSREIKLAE